VKVICNCLDSGRSLKFPVFCATQCVDNTTKAVLRHLCGLVVVTQTSCRSPRLITEPLQIGCFITFEYWNPRIISADM